MDDAPLERGAVVADRYRVDAPLGEGGMARVYRGVDLHLDRPVALKVMRLAAAAHAARFEREARSAAQLAHPAVVSVYDHGLLADGRPYLVLEFIAGSNLAQAGTVDPETAVRWLRPIVGALVEAHAIGIIHRDIKPENLILTSPPGLDPTPRLLDFGIAAVDPMSSDQRLTATGAVFGTPAFMAPEQAMGKPTTAAVDLWAVGATLYALIAGRAPFAGETPPETLVAVIKDRPEPLPDSVPRWVRDVVGACLEKDPSARPPSAKALLERMTNPSHSTHADTVFQPQAPKPPRDWRLFGGGALLLAIGVGVGLALGGSDPAGDGSANARVAAPATSAASAPPQPAVEAPRADPLESAEKLIAADEHAAALAWLETHEGKGEPNRRLVLRGLARLGVAQTEAGLSDLTAALTADPRLAKDARLAPAVVAVMGSRDGAGAVGLLSGPLAAQAKASLADIPGKGRLRARWRAVEILEAIDPDDQGPRFAALMRDLAVGDCEQRKRAARGLSELGNRDAIGGLRRARNRGWLDNMCMDGALDRAIRKLREAEK